MNTERNSPHFVCTRISRPAENKSDLVFGTSESLLSVRWKVHLPNEHINLGSPWFYFGDRKLRFYCRSLDTSNEHVICLSLDTDESRILDPPLTVSVRVEGGIDGSVFPELTQPKIPFSGLSVGEAGLIWMRFVREVKAANPAFCWELQLTFLVTIGDADSVTDESSESDENSSFCLEEDFAKLLDGNSDTDVELHCEGHTTKAHKKILCARSSVLASMLESEMAEGRTGVANIPDMTNDTLQQFLRYLYTGKLDVDTLTFDAALRLYKAGVIYAVTHLSSRCSKFLIRSLTLENAYDVLVVADAHSDSSFVEAVIGFMLEKRIPMSGDRWRDFCESHSKLANKVYGRFYEMMLEEEINLGRTFEKQRMLHGMIIRKFEEERMLGGRMSEEEGMSEDEGMLEGGRMLEERRMSEGGGVLSVCQLM